MLMKLKLRFTVYSARGGCSESALIFEPSFFYTTTNNKAFLLEWFDSPNWFSFFLTVLSIISDNIFTINYMPLFLINPIHFYINSRLLFAILKKCYFIISPQNLQKKYICLKDNETCFRICLCIVTLL